MVLVWFSLGFRFLGLGLAQKREEILGWVHLLVGSFAGWLLACFDYLVKSMDRRMDVLR